jgi:Melibiase
MRKMKSWIVVLTLIGWTAHNLGAATHNIYNAKLSAEYEDLTKTFSIAERITGKTFLMDGKLEGDATNATVNPAKDVIFGKGKTITIAQSDGSTVSLELYDSLPFVLIRKEQHNSGTMTTDFQKVVPVKFMLDLGKPAAELRTMGTAGLTAPDKHPGSYLFLTLADPATRRGVVAGWLTEDRGSGVMFSRLKDGMVEFKAQIDYGHLRIPAGKSERLETLAIGVFDDARLGEESYADAIKEHYQIKLRPQVAGHCTWYSEVGGLTDKAGGAGCSNEKDIAALTEFAARELKPYGFSFVQIDDGWQDGEVFNGPKRGFTRAAPNGSYPNGMAPVAEMIKSNGLTAGLWFLPFARNHQDPEYKDRQHWFMKRLDGKPYETVWGGTSLDLTHPEVQAHLTELAKIIRSWGYDYFKMDGLWTGSVTEQIYVNDGYKDDDIGNYQPFHDPMKTSIEALRDGLKLLRKGAGPEVFLSGCCASQNMRSLGGSIGLVDSMRIGPDNGFGWQDYRNEVMHFEGGGIITGPIRGNRLYFLNGRVWWNDPDPSYVRPAVKLNHAQLLASWVAVSGMFNLNSDWLPGLPPERLDILKRCLPSHHAIARPVDYFDSSMPRIWLATDTSQSVRRDVMGLYNWDSEARFIGYDAAKAGLDGEKTYYAFDFWSKSPLPSFKGAFNVELPAESCRVIAVRAAEGHPVLVSTSRHVTQGMVDVTNEKWDSSSGTLTGVSQIIGNDPYELRIAGINDSGRKWKLVSAFVPVEEMAGGVTATPEAAIACEDDWLRILIASKNSRAVKWSLKFAEE